MPPRAKARGATKKARQPGDDFTVSEWCARRRISRIHFYELRRLGLAPKSMKNGKFRTISEQADREWGTAREEASA